MFDPFVVVVQPAADDPPGRLLDWLGRAGAQVRVLPAFGGDQVPDSLTALTERADVPEGAPVGLIVLGGRGSAVGTDPMLPALRSLLADAVRHVLPTWGICLGAQLLAQGAGGRVGPNPDGPEFGAQLIAKRQNAANDALLGSLPITPDVLQWHYDAVLAMPAGATLLASSPGCEVQAFRVGARAWGTQFHVEAPPDVVRGWAAADLADGLDLIDYDVDAILARVDAADDDIAAVWEPVAAAFVSIVRRSAGGSDEAPSPQDDSVGSAGDGPERDPIAAAKAALAGELSASRQAPVPLGLPVTRRDA